MADTCLALSIAAPGASGSAWWSWGLWSWPGWSAVTAAAAAATAAALVLVWRELRSSGREGRHLNEIVGAQIEELRNGQEHREARLREEYERTQTPYLSLEVLPGPRRQEDRWVAGCRVNADGGGVAYNVTLNLVIPSLHYTDVAAVRYLRAPGSASVELRWPLHVERDARIEVVFTSRFGRVHRVSHGAFVQDDGSLRIADTPSIEDLYVQPAARARELVPAGNHGRPD
jgi:hypothetical protein